MAEELLAQTAGRIDAFVMRVGTGGCFSGNAAVLERRLPSVTCVAVTVVADSGLKYLQGNLFA